MDVNKAIDRAVALHQGGDLAGAEVAYRGILAVVPDLADIHYLLGMACLGQGRPVAAAGSLRQALHIKDGQAEWWHNLGVALRQTGDQPGAVNAFAKAVTLFESEPVRRAEALAEQGALLARSGDGTAESVLRAAVALAPGRTGADGNLAALLFNRFTDDASLSRPGAAAVLEEAAALAPDNMVIRTRLGLALLRVERPAEALAVFDQVAAQLPADMLVMLGRSDALTVLGRFGEAALAAERAAAMAPGKAAPLVALGAARHGQGDLHGALAALRAAVQADPDSLPAQLNLGTLLRDMGDDGGAEECYQRALLLAPSFPPVHWQRAQARLLAGDLAEGWREYEWRWGMPSFRLSPTLYALPEWDGVRPAPGAMLLVHAEQGHGDSLQFVRYVPLLHARGVAVHLQVQPALVRLFRDSLPDGIAVEKLGAPIPRAVTCRCPLLGLPLRMGTTTLEAIPAQTPYLRVPADRRAHWRGRLDGLPGRRVGLVWAGDGRADDPRAAAVDKRRSLSLRELAPLGMVAGVSFVSLQKGPNAATALAPFALHDWTGELADFADTAALVAELDLVIGVDTAVIHLSAGLARPTWVLSRFDGCWRWLRHRRDNPWYQRLRLFRQEQWGDWYPAVDELVNELVQWTSSRVDEVETRPQKPIP